MAAPTSFVQACKRIRVGRTIGIATLIVVGLILV